MKFEIIHDTIAKQVFEKASTEARTRRKVEKFIRERFEAHQARGAKLTRDDLDYIQPYLNQVNISTEENSFIEKARKALIDERNRNRAIVAGVIILLLGSTAFSGVQWRNAIKQKEVADKQTIKAKEAQQADSLKAIDLGIALEEAKAAKDTAEIARIKAEQETLRADMQARRALNQKILAEQSAKEAKSLAISVIAENMEMDELETSLRVIEAAYLKTYPNPPPAEVQQNLLDKFYGQLHKEDQMGARIADYFPHKSEVKNYSFSPDQKYLASYADDSTFYLWSVDGQLIANPTEHDNDITSLSFSPDGKQILSSSFDGSAKLWNLKGEETAHMMMVNDGEQLRNRRYNARFSPDGKYIFTQVSDTLKLWNKRGDKICDLEGKMRISSNDHFLTLREDSVLLYDYKGNKKAFKERSDTWSFNFTPDKQKLLGVTGKLKVTLWNLEGDTLFHSSPWDSLGLGPADEFPINLRPSVKMYPEINRILLFGGGDFLGKRKEVFLMDFEGKLLRHFSAFQAMIPHASASVFCLNVDSLGLQAMFYDKDGTLIKKNLIDNSFSQKPAETNIYLSASPNTFWVSKAGEDRALYEFHQRDDTSWYQAWVYKVPQKNEYDPYRSNQHYLVSSSYGNKYWAINPEGIENGSSYPYLNYILREKGEPMFTVEGDMPHFTKDNRFVFVVNGKNIKRVELEASLIKKIKIGEENIRSRLSRNKSRIISYPVLSGRVVRNDQALLKVYDLNARLLHEFPFPRSFNRPVYAEDMQYWMSTHKIPGRGRRGKGAPVAQLKVYDSNGETLNSLAYGSNATRKQQFLPKSTSILLNGFQQNSAIIWDFKSGRLDTIRHEGKIKELVPSPDGKYIVSYESEGGKVKCWDQQGKLLFQKLLGNTRISKVSFAPDSKSFLMSSYDKMVRRFSVNGNLQQTFGPYSDFISSISFSPSGNFILINYKNTVLLKRSNGGTVFKIGSDEHDIYDAYFSPSGKYIWTRNDSNDLQIWNKSGRLIAHLKGKKPSFSSTENLILTQTDESEEILWNIQGEQIEILKGNHKFVDFAPDGKSYLTQLVYNARSSTEFRPLQVWDESGKILASLPGTELHKALGYSPDNKFIWTEDYEGKELTRWPLPQTVFEYLRNEARFPQLSDKQKRSYRIN